MSTEISNAAQAHADAVDDVELLKSYVFKVPTDGYPKALTQVLEEQWNALEAEALKRAEAHAAQTLATLKTLITPPAPPVRTAVRGPLGFCYDNTTNVNQYEGRGALLVAGRENDCNYRLEAFQRVRRAGGEVYCYLIPSERPNVLIHLIDREFYGPDINQIPLWPFPRTAPGTRYKWANEEGVPTGRMTDMRPGSSMITRTVAFIEKLIREGLCDGVFLDTVGSMTWHPLADWNNWSLEEKDAYTEGNLELVRLIDEKRKQLNREDFGVVNNSIWQRGDNVPRALEGEKFVDGICIEHHPYSSTFHRLQAARAFKGNAVTHVSGQTTPQYSYPLAPAVPLME
jgi:hypothetical protein